MVAFQITINGKPYGQAGDITAITIVAEERRRGDRVSIHVSSGDDQKLQWLGAHLNVGDEIQVRIIDAADAVDVGPEGCNFCGRTMHDLEMLVHGVDVAICNQCVVAFASSVMNSVQLPLGASIHAGTDQACGFCKKQSGALAGVVVRNGAAICPECLHACSDVMMGPSG